MRTSTEQSRAEESVARTLYRLAGANRLGSVANLILQAGLLAVSLWTLAYDQDVVPPWVAIVLAVGGILLLAWTLTLAGWLRREWSKYSGLLPKPPYELPDQSGGPGSGGP